MSLISMLASLALLCCNAEGNNPTDLGLENTAELVLVGSSKKDITPPPNLGIGMSGYSARTGSFSGIHDRLYVRTLVITDQDDGHTTIHCSIDQLSFASNHLRELYDRVTSEIDGLENIPISNLFVTATHTHGGPSTVNRDNTENRNDIMFESIKEAFQNRKAAQMRVGVTTVTNVNVNRQNPHYGVHLGNFVCPLEINPAGDSDQDAHFIEFVGTDGLSIASMFTFGVHSTVMGLHNLKITGDLAGYASRYIEEHTNPDHISLFLYSGGGDQSPIDRTQDAHLIDHVNTGVKAYGDRLGSQVLPAFQNGVFVQDVSISSIAMPLTLERDWQPQDDIPDTLETVALYGIRYSDNVAVIATPFELFSATVKELKKNSPFGHTLILSLTNGARSYLAPESTYNRKPNSTRDDPEAALYTIDQCYENRTSIYTSGAEGEFVTKCTQLINDLKQ
ncbi:MAG: neutral/alkaline non-lysosomal ceramidase N-terminal domain-containing protein [Flavobacteriaceae bacterium]